MKKIILITSGQPTLNPRLVKEADTLSESGYDVEVIYQYISDWATKKDSDLLKHKIWKATCVGGDPKINKFAYQASRIVNKWAFIFLKLTGLYMFFALRAFNRNTITLIKHAKKIKADLYIAHNLAALPAAVKAAKKNNAFSGFDAEDFHRKEYTNDENSFDYTIKKYIEDLYIPQLNYLSAASPLIAETYQLLYPMHQVIPINNVFDVMDGIDGLESLKENKTLDPNDIKLFWFSQTIGKERGLEDVIQALNEIKSSKLSLHLLGNLSPENKIYFNNLSHSKITFYEPISSDEVLPFSSQFDIGLALEIHDPYNRQICLSNKIFSYLASGLSIIATDTKGQKNFLTQHPEIGNIYKSGNINDLTNILKAYLNDTSKIEVQKKSAYNLAQRKYNWKLEKHIFLNKVNDLFA